MSFLFGRSGLDIGGFPFVTFRGKQIFNVMDEELLFGFVGAIRICVHEIEILLVLQHFTGRAVFDSVLMIAAKALRAFNNGNDTAKQTDNKSDGRAAGCIIGKQRNGCSNDQLSKLHPFIGALGLLSLFIVPGDLIIQAVLDVAVDIARYDLRWRIRLFGRFTPKKRNHNNPFFLGTFVPGIFYIPYLQHIRTDDF